jgi:hypothetical protein
MKTLIIPISVKIAAKIIPTSVIVAAKAAGVSASLLLSICTVETGMKNVNNYTDPHHGSFGVCQLNLKTARSIRPEVDRLALQQPSVNLEIAALYLKQLHNKYHNSHHEIAAYNAGHARLEAGIYLNQDYVNKVLAYYER